jgi:transitional endoplasmic reticulum ATPase
MNAPAFILFDEMDSLAPKRATVVGDVEKRVVAQLLALMDGLVGRGEIVIIGATNMPELVDFALRRPGRFDREITIGVPKRDERLEILKIHSRKMPLAEDVDLIRLAEITHGYVGADIPPCAPRRAWRPCGASCPRSSSRSTRSPSSRKASGSRSPPRTS